VTLDAPTPIVWLGEAPVDADATATLSAWARSHGIRLEPPARFVPKPLPVDLNLAATVEDQLDAARDAIAAGSSTDADQALGAAQAVLGSHPELPNAAWLMAEVERGRAARWRRIVPADPEAAERSSARADALDSGRMAGANERAAPPGQGSTLTFRMRPSREAQVWLDGVPVTAGAVESVAGPHALVVTWAGAPFWASWIETPPGPSIVPLSALDPSPCSDADFEQVRAVRDRVEADLTRCGNWIAVAPGGTSGTIRFAICQNAACSSLTEWRPPPVWSKPLEPEHKHSGLPAWAAWGLVGTGVAVATGVVIGVVASSSRSAPQAEFVLGGLDTK
jgi:hypothetical protein